MFWRGREIVREAGAGLGWMQGSWNVAVKQNPHIRGKLENANRAGWDEICPITTHNYIPIPETSTGSEDSAAAGAVGL